MTTRKQRKRSKETATPPQRETNAVRCRAAIISLVVVALAVAVVMMMDDSALRHGRIDTHDASAQLGFAQRAGVSPLTVVLSTRKGRGVFYAGDDELPAGSAVGVFRALLVGPAALDAWRADGTLDWAFWRRYAVTVEDDEGKRYLALPVGELGALDEPTWWRQGPLAAPALADAKRALRQRVVVDFSRLTGGPDGPALLTGHLLNEPSPGEDESVGHLAGSSCAAAAGGEDACGAAFVALTRRAVQPGEELTWCYGEDYARDYDAAPACLDDAARERRG